MSFGRAFGALAVAGLSALLLLALLFAPVNTSVVSDVQNRLAAQMSRHSGQRVPFSQVAGSAQMRASTVAVAERTLMGQSHGHGVAWDARTILTNRHVVDSMLSSGVYVQTHDGRWLKADRVIFIDGGPDVAFLVFDMPHGLPVPPRAEPVPEGAALYYYITRDDELYTGTRGPSNVWALGLRVTVMNMHAFPGMSGGPVYTADGAFVGLVTVGSGAEGPESGYTNLADIERVEDALRRHGHR
jgi:S1-C subfamily serine protease